MDRREMEACLEDALRPESSVRKAAEGKILGMQSRDFGAFVLVLTEIFCDLESNDQLKMISGIILKNSLHANDPELQRGCEGRWLGLELQTREDVKGVFRKGLRGRMPRFCVMAGAILGQIAKIEMPQGIYQGFFEEMRMMVRDEEAACGACEAVGVCCNYLIEESVEFTGTYGPTVFEVCMYPLESSSRREGKLASLKCFMNSMEIQDVFEQEGSINRFLNATIGIWNGGDEELIHKSMICFNRLVGLNYRFIKKTVLEDMLMHYVNKFFVSNSDDIRIQAVEYWCIFAEKRDEEIVNKYLHMVLPEILKLLEKGADYYDEMWSPHKAAASCLEMYTEMKGREMMENGVVRSFVESSLMSKDGMRMDVGAVALGSVMCGKCEEYLARIVPYLISGVELMESKDSCLWALSRIAEYNFYGLITHLPAVLERSGAVVMEGSKFSVSAAWVMDCVFSSIAESRRSSSFAKHIPEELRRKPDAFVNMFLTKQYLDILNILIKGTEVAGLDDSNLRVALFSALTELVGICPPSASNILDEFYGYTSRKIEECLSVIGCATQNQLLIIEDVLSNYIGLIEAIEASRGRESIEDLVGLFVRILDSTPTVAFGEVYIAVSKLSGQFSPHMSRMLPYIIRDMGCTDRFVLKSVINLVGTQANAMGTDFNVLATVLTSSLVQCLSSESTPRDIKPLILSVFGDIALALEKNFESYLEMVVTLLSQIAGLHRHGDEEFVDELRKNAVQLVNCSLMAIGDSIKIRGLLPQTMGLIHKIQMEDADRVSSNNILGFIDDLISIYGKNFGLDEVWIRDFLYNMERHGNEGSRRKATHALEMLR